MTGRLVAIFGSSRATPEEPEWDDAFRCGELLAHSGFGIATGGYGGIMEAASAGAAAGGGRVVGITAPAVFPDRAGANPHVAEEWPAPNLVTRIGDLLERTDACIALPGSIGTLTELVMAWNIAFVARFSAQRPQPVVAVGPGWERIVDTLGAALAADTSVVHCAANVDAAVAHVVDKLVE